MTDHVKESDGRLFLFVSGHDEPMLLEFVDDDSDRVKVNGNIYSSIRAFVRSLNEGAI